MPELRSPDWEVATRELNSRLVLVTAAIGLLLGVLVAAGTIRHGNWRGMDAEILLWFQAVTGGSTQPRLAYFARDVTALGGVTVLSALVFSVTGYLLLQRHTRTAFALFAITVSGWLMSHSLKIAIARPRPDLVPHGMTETTASFPSGHALVSMIVFVTLGSMLARVEQDMRVRAFLFYLALAFSLAIGTTRIFLGVHWPSDVLGGWILGLIWVMAGMRILDAITRLNPPTSGP